tara:strand:- start:958 stop:3987 length:3030 start_codon:yes stop_codon:yes gene_type:complete
MPVSRSKQKESIDERILRIIGLEDIFDIDYETYLTLLKEAMVKARMPKTKLSSEESDLLLDEFRRVKSKKDKGRFEVKKKRISASALRGAPAGRKTAQSRPVRQLAPARARPTADPSTNVIVEDKGKYSPQLESDVAGILTSVTSILDTLKSRQTFLKNRSSAERRKLEKQKRTKRENKLEEKKAAPLRKVTEKIFKPVKSLLGGILDFFVNMFLARIFIKFINWMANPENRKKLVNTFRFLSNFWPVFAAAALGFGTGLVGFAGKLITTLGGLTLRLLSLAPRLAAAARFGKFGKFGAAAGLFTFGAWGPAMFPGLLDDEETRKRKGFSGGGLVPGLDFANMGTDTVPAMLTPGEFVMSPGAVDLIGADTLAQLNLLGGGTNKPRDLNGVSYASGGGMIGFPQLGGGGGGLDALTNQAKVRTLRSSLFDPTGIKARRAFFNDPNAYLSDEDFQNRGIFPEDRNRRKRGRGAGSPPDGYASGARKESTGFKQFKEKYISGDDSLLNLVALGEHEKALEILGFKIDHNTTALNENTRQRKEDNQLLKGVEQFVNDRQKDLENGMVLGAAMAQNAATGATEFAQRTTEFAQKLNPLPAMGRGLSSIAAKPYFGEEAIDKLTKERIASGELGADGLGLTKTTQANLDAHDAYIRGLYDPEKDTGLMGGLKKINQDIQNKGLIADPFALLGLKSEGFENFVEKISGGRVKNFGAKLTGVQMAAKGLAGPLGRMFQIDDRGSLGRYLRPAMEYAISQGHTSVGARAFGQEKYNQLVGDKLANLALGQVNFEIDEQGRAKTSDVFDASAMTPKQYLEASRSNLLRAGNILQGKEEGGLGAFGKALYQSAFMGLSGRLATAQNTGFGNLRPMGLDIDLGGGFTPKKTPLSEKQKQSAMAMIMGGKDAYYSSTTGRYYTNYAEALKDPQVAAAAKVEETKNRFRFAGTQTGNNRSTPPPMRPKLNAASATIINGGASTALPPESGPVQGNEPQTVSATPSGFDWARQQVMSILGMGG